MAPEIYTDLIEAFYVEEVVLKKKTVKEIVQSIIDDFATLYTAGTDTTSHAAQMALYYLATHPEELKLLREDLEKLGKDTPLTYESLHNCHYLEAVIMETLRMYNTANGIFPREAIDDHYLTVGDVKIPVKKGTIVNAQTLSTHHKSTIYPHPAEFTPSRWIQANGEVKTPEPFSFMTFSAGTRSCIGRQLSITELRTILATVVRGFDLLVEDSKKEMVFYEFAYNLKGVEFKLVPRGQ